MNVWVIGANGLLGKALILALHKKAIPHVGSTKEQADITQLESIVHFFHSFGPFTHIVNCAAYTAVDLAESQYENAYLLNAHAPALLGQFAANLGVRLTHLSTDYVFDGTASRPYREEDPIAPQTVYGKTKAEGEQRLAAIYPQACIIRTSWLFGTGKKNFVTTLLQRMKEQEEIRMVSDQMGRPTYASDLASSLIEALNWSGLYHIANTEETTWFSFAEAIREEALKRNLSLRCQRICPILSAEWGASAKRPLYSVLDTTKAEQLLKRPVRSWKTALCDAFTEF